MEGEGSEKHPVSHFSASASGVDMKFHPVVARWLDLGGPLFANVQNLYLVPRKGLSYH